jgi:hypothetical protein
VNDGCAIPRVFTDLLFAASLRDKCAAGLCTWDFCARRSRQRDVEGVCHESNTTQISHIHLAVQHSTSIVRASHFPNREVFRASSSYQHLRVPQPAGSTIIALKTIFVSRKRQLPYTPRQFAKRSRYGINRTRQERQRLHSKRDSAVWVDSEMLLNHDSDLLLYSACDIALPSYQNASRIRSRDYHGADAVPSRERNGFFLEHGREHHTDLEFRGAAASGGTGSDESHPRRCARWMRMAAPHDE